MGMLQTLLAEKFACDGIPFKLSKGHNHGQLRMKLAEFAVFIYIRLEILPPRESSFLEIVDGSVIHVVISTTPAMVSKEVNNMS